MTIIQELLWRGLVKDTTDLEAIQEMTHQPITLYAGFDPTGDSLHVGHLVPLLLLRRFQLAGHHSIALAGGATGMIGDPRPTTERQLLTADQVKHNVECIKKQLSMFLDFEGVNPAKLVNNYDWTQNLSLIDFLRDYGKHFNLNYMLAKDTISSRLATGISYTEFSYMILQSMDYLHLFKEFGCKLQIGGSDQWGNVTAGVELIRKAEGANTGVQAMTVPLITKSDGTKFGKSEGGAIWLDPTRTSPYEFYQFWINTQDADVEKYLKIFTFLSQEDITTIVKEHLEAPHLRLGQRTLAKELTTLVHGEDRFLQAKKISEVLFSGDISSLTLEEIDMCFKDVKSEQTTEDILLIDVLILTGAAKSKREAREFISGGSVMVNGQKITDVEFLVTKENAFEQKATVLRRGKKLYFILRHG